MTKRRSELSWLNVAFCLLVVLIHVLSKPVAQMDRASWQYLAVLIPQRLAFLSVPGFFLLSGVKLSLRPPEKLGRYYLRRCRTILLPYLLAVAVYFLYFLRIGWVEASFRRLVGYWLVGDLSSHFYFVVALVQFILLTPLWLWLSRRFDPVVLLLPALAITWLSAQYLNSYVSLIFPGSSFAHSDRIFTTYLVFFLGGCCVGRNYHSFTTLLEKYRRFLGFGFLIFCLLDGLGSALVFSGRSGFPGLGEYHLGQQIFGVLFFFSLAVKLPPLPGPAAALDRASYLIYLYHCLAISIFNGLIPDSLDMGLQLILRLVFVYGITILGCILWQTCLRNIKNCLKNMKERSK